MARIRTVKPSFFSSLSNADLPIPTRITWIGLWTYVDDKGRGVDDPRLVKAAVWPLDEGYTTKKVEADLALLAKAGKIGRYVVDGQHYLAVVKWKEHQRIDKPQKSILPPAPWEDDSRNVPGTPPPDDGNDPRTPPPEAGGEGKGSGREVEGKGTVVDPSPNHLVGLAPIGKSEMDRPQGQPQPPRPPVPPDPLLERLLGVWPGRNGVVPVLAKQVLTEARRWLDDRLLDEVVGHMLGMDPPPATPRYLLTVAANWAEQRGASLSAEAIASMRDAAKSPSQRAAS